MSHSLRYFLLISIPAVFGLSALAKPLLRIFLLYNGGFPFWLVCDPDYRFIRPSSRNRSNFYQYTINCQKNESANLYQFCCGSFDLCINLLLIPSIGIVGAAIPTLLAYFFMAILCTRMSLKYFKHDFYFHDIAKSILSSVAMYFFVSHFEILRIRKLLEVAVMGVLVYLFVMFLLGGFSEHATFFDKKIFIWNQEKPCQNYRNLNS